MYETPIQLTEPTEVTWTLNEEQRARAFAVSVAKPLLTATSGFTGKTPPDVGDLIRLAAWILDGQQGDRYPYTDSEGAVHLGPDVWMKPEGYLWANGVLYEPTPKEES